MLNPLETHVIVIMEKVTYQMFVQQGDSLLLQKKGKRKRKEKDMQLRTMNMQWFEFAKEESDERVNFMM